MAISQAFCSQAKLDYLNGQISSSHTFKIALYTSAATMDGTTLTYSATNEAVGAGYTAGGITLSGYSSSLSGSTAQITWTSNPTIATASLTAHGAMIYDSTYNNRAIAILSFGADYTATSGSYTVNLPTGPQIISIA